MIKTRIAPSPTGKFHIGTARTALVNYIFAKQKGGQFLLRMEDTDKERNKIEFENDIKDGLSWLGLNWDGEIVYQSNRAKRYHEIINQLINSGNAYKKDGAIWFKVPERKTIEFDDLVRGKVKFKSEDMKDFVILRSDNSPIFYLTGVVDDHDSSVSHVIRGEEHLSNTPKQILIIQVLEWSLPIYAHLPLILNTDRSKMSKRKDPVSITNDFKDKGYLAEAIINYLFLLGFHPVEKFQNPNYKFQLKSKLQNKNSKTFDIYSIDEMLKSFDILRVQKGGAVFDIEKLNSINHYYIQQISDDVLVEKLNNYQGKVSDDVFARFISIVKPRLKYFKEAEEELGWLEKTFNYSAEQLIFKKSDIKTTKEALLKIAEGLSHSATLKVAEINGLFNGVITKNSFSNGDVYWSSRVALSGLEKSPPPEELIWVLGKEESLKRIKSAIKKLNNAV